MTTEQWVLEAARILSYFHRTGLLLGAILFVAILIRKWGSLDAMTAAFGQVIGATFAGIAIPEAIFPLYWIVWHGRPISDISPTWVEYYVYSGSFVIILLSIVGVRTAWK